MKLSNFILKFCNFFLKSESFLKIGYQKYLENRQNEVGKLQFQNFPKVEQLICTLGPKGAIVIKDSNQYFYEATETKVIDKTGAGDFFAAGYLYGLQKNLSIDESAQFANKSAAHVISEIGVRPEKEFT